ncbi:GIY-YIG nuclease superfamily protein [Paraliobacillus sp. PM-2]|uniref:GIY-YIG nuclease family protein n=1 Tax=Paraliobacillus sp. PM-2 TaxID=1462524 RepID=UPI00061C5435|nr:GIY-YIG nuclease family protein [Paraliobacillus sp. PM-2]CQR47499.1 GIY-YIG nuclease superfamily protein [Paraliobacillus sp. PM-2]
METEYEHVVYILECKDGTLYTGYTNNLFRRLAMHESGKGAKYTRGRGPFLLKYYEAFQTKEEAMKQEYYIKQLKRSEKINRIRAFQKEEDRCANTKKL